MKKRITLLTITFALSVWDVNSQVLVRDIIPGYASPYSHTFCGNNGLLFFSANDRIYGSELWKSDGTEPGTVMVKDIRPGSFGGYGAMNDMAAMGGNVYFEAMDGVNGYELWKSDGTDAGTIMVKDIRPGSLSSSPSTLYVMNNILFFMADDGINGPELWKSDGTMEGTVMIKDILPGIYGMNQSNPANFMAVNGFLYFEARISTVGNNQLWKSDGTEAGTSFVKEIGGGYKYLTEFNGKLYFEAGNSTSGTELCVSDGTDAGTFVLKDINPGVGGSYPANLTVFNGNLYFIAGTATSGRELWKTDGTLAGTVLVKDINTGTGGMNSPDSKLVAGTGSLFFFAYTATAGSELWKTDGTAGGTIIVKDVNPGTNPGTDLNYANSIIMINGVIYFSGNNGTQGAELWESDGTEIGTTMVKDIMPPGFTISSSSFPDMFYNHGGVLYFTADNGTTDRELWKYDPSNPVSINFLAKSNTLNIQPNPANNTFSISTDKPTNISISNIFGQEVWNGSIQNNQPINISSFAKGMYIVKTTETGQALKLIKE